MCPVFRIDHAKGPFNARSAVPAAVARVLINTGTDCRYHVVEGLGTLKESPSALYGIDPSNCFNGIPARINLLNDWFGLAIGNKQGTQTPGRCSNSFKDNR